MRLFLKKRTRYRGVSDFDVIYSGVSDDFNIFVDLDVSKFKRALSNLIDNAAEATGSGGSIEVSTILSDGFVTTQIRDNGPGIPTEILSQIGERGVTHGKKGGSGLGIWSAKETFESFGGRVEISSASGLGTSVRCVIPVSEPPKWHLGFIDLRNVKRVMILDDEKSIHEIWEKRFSDMGIEIAHSYDVKTLKASLPSDVFDLYLLDHEIGSAKERGLELIEHYKLAGKAVLVTSYFGDSDVQAKCTELGCKLLSKGYVGRVRINVG